MKNCESIDASVPCTLEILDSCVIPVCVRVCVCVLRVRVCVCACVCINVSITGLHIFVMPGLYTTDIG